MHYVTKIDLDAAGTPEIYAGHSQGYKRATYADQTTGSVHMGVGIAMLDAGGGIERHLHSFEETFYVLEGNPTLQIGEQAHVLSAGNFGMIETGMPHAWRNTGDQATRWIEMQSPQPRLRDYGRDTFFVGGDALVAGGASEQGSFIGFFDEAQLPKPGAPSEMEGFNPTTGVAIKMFVDRSFGATHQSLFLIQYMPGAKIDPHDHAFEESYYIISGRVQATADGETYDLGQGDAIWTSVGCVHSFVNVGDEPVRWIETQAPLPPAKEVFRFERDWVRYAANE